MFPIVPIISEPIAMPIQNGFVVVKIKISPNTIKVVQKILIPVQDL
jgi:hypothetical protein